MQTLIGWLLKNRPRRLARHAARFLVWWLLLAVAAGIVPFTFFREKMMTASAMLDRPVETTIPEPGAAGNPPRFAGPAFRRIRETIFLGFAVLDAAARPKSMWQTLPEKIDAEIELSVGGGAVNAARSFQHAGGQPAVLAAITGADETGNMVFRLLGEDFTRLRRAATAIRTRVSLVVPRSGPGSDTTTWTIRPELDAAATFAHLKPLLSQSRRVVLASMAAEQAPLVGQILDSHPGQTVMMLTSSQCEDAETTLGLARRCSLIQLNTGDLATLTAIQGDVVASINWLRERQVKSVIVTAGHRGIIAYIGGQWLYAPAFEVDVPCSTSRCGDIVLGTFLAGIDRGETVPGSLRMASAAAAMQAAGVAPPANWEAITSYAASTPTRRFEPESQAGFAARSQPHAAAVLNVARRIAQPLGYLIAGALVAIWTVLWMS